jgi:hypothetical protein
MITKSVAISQCLPELEHFSGILPIAGPPQVSRLSFPEVK